VFIILFKQSGHIRALCCEVTCMAACIRHRRQTVSFNSVSKFDPTEVFDPVSGPCTYEYDRIHCCRCAMVLVHIRRSAERRRYGSVQAPAHHCLPLRPQPAANGDSICSASEKPPAERIFLFARLNELAASERTFVTPDCALAGLLLDAWKDRGADSLLTAALCHLVGHKRQLLRCSVRIL
jgi:hypothetical protein